MNKRSFKAKVKKARALTKEIQKLENGILENVDLEGVPFDGINSDDLLEAITCFIVYGEGVASVPNDDEDEIIDALWLGYQEQLK